MLDTLRKKPAPGSFPSPLSVTLGENDILGSFPSCSTFFCRHFPVDRAVATRRSWKNTDDEWASKTEWHRVCVFRPRLSEYVSTTIKKGSHVLVEGRAAGRTHQRLSRWKSGGKPPHSKRFPATFQCRGRTLNRLCRSPRSGSVLGFWPNPRPA